MGSMPRNLAYSRISTWRFFLALVVPITVGRFYDDVPSSVGSKLVSKSSSSTRDMLGRFCGGEQDFYPDSRALYVVSVRREEIREGGGPITTKRIINFRNVLFCLH